MPIDQSVKELLDSLQPKKRRTIIDAVEAAGVSVAPWYVKAGVLADKIHVLKSAESKVLYYRSL